MKKRRREPSWITESVGDIGRNVASFRKVYGLTQAELADRAKVSKDTISRLERGDSAVSIYTLMAVMHVFGVDDKVTEATHPFTTAIGRARADAVLGKRVVHSRRKEADHADEN